MSTLFAELLGFYLHREESSIPRLSRLSGIPLQTLKNWLAGKTIRPRSQPELLAVADVLHLNKAERDELLLAAGHTPLRDKARVPQAMQLKDPASTDSGRRRPARSAPFQGPATLSTFVGRYAELSLVEHWLCADGPDRTICLRGMAGVGKTVLAAHLCHRLRDRFPDGILWAQLDSSNTVSIYRQFSDALGISFEAIADQKRFLSRLFHRPNRRILMVLDNAGAARLVRPFQPPPGARAAVLVTTRNNLHLERARTVDLMPFASDNVDALSLFERYLGPAASSAQADALTEIAKRVGQLPMALAIVAGHLRSEERDPYAVARILDRLSRSATRLAHLERDDLVLRLSFAVSYDSLSDEQREFIGRLHQLGLMEFETAAAATVAETVVEEADARLEWLADRSLLRRTPSGRWQFHPLLLDFVRGRATKSRRSRTRNT